MEEGLKKLWSRRQTLFYSYSAGQNLSHNIKCTRDQVIHDLGKLRMNFGGELRVSVP